MGKRKTKNGIAELDDAPAQMTTENLISAIPPNELQEIVASMLEESAEPQAEEKPEIKRMSMKMAAFSRQVLRRIQEALVDLEGSSQLGEPCPCHNLKAQNDQIHGPPAIYRCRECFIPELLCVNCISAAHLKNPFHHIQRWNGSFFERASLNDTGFVIHLGHRGAPCPHNSKSPSQFIVAFIQREDKHIQLIQHQLFAPTIDRPKTVFTFAVLKHFHRHSLSSKMNLYDYCNALQEDTNAAFPAQVPDRYEEFTRVMRFWRFLRMERQSGVFHQIERLLNHRRAGCIAVRCPACPEVGFNTDITGITPTELKEKMHLYTLFISADGNFRLQRKLKNNDPDDISLVDGNAYFVNEREFREFLKEIESQSDESTCSKLKAVRQQNKQKFLNAVITGVIAIQCSRHGVYLPQGIVDLDKGEAYARTDYALANALNTTEGPRHPFIMLSYNIWCQYSKKLSTRGAIPKMHISGHGIDCQINKSFLYTPKSAMTCGEGIESAWAEQNFAAGSTKEQNAGHRHDTLDDYNGYWNWTKVHQLGDHLLTQCNKWSTLLKRRKTSFDQWTKMLAPDLIEKWNAMSTMTHSKKELYLAKTDAPTRDKTQSNLLEEALRAHKHGGTPIVEFISLGIQIEDIQEKIRNSTSESVEADRSTLLALLHEWREDQHRLFPSLRPLPLIKEDCPEDVALHLPSSYSASERDQLGITDAAMVELRIRRACAFDALSSIRNEIFRSNREKKNKRNQPRSQKQNTRLQKEFREIEEFKDLYHSIYTRMYKALRALGDTDGTLQPLLKKDMWGKNMGGAHVTGDSTREEPWFWWVGKPDDVTEENWAMEWDRVHWMRERASIERLEEEVELIQEEFRRTITSFTKMAEVWTQLGSPMDERSPGFCCYALRTAEMYRGLARNCETNRRLAYSDQC
ncbi:hypothetical protein NP233_g10727 [Leucocoprinus birnbaumii]|uniref:CxC2-like cysteine cluster KDZ transposase-associated domain-containing protein n=1 Tax=Leucocoprinus birnbaumii TaxID=56174 RepID=A0AAD5VJU2_9AGAR|nr:hypothetical protein NP233_g10727 [Leucocoprinus birnbaumii]